MKLSKRIYSLRDTVNNGETVADIGTDHGYVPMLLVRDNISPFVIMSDISSDSLSKSVETFNNLRINISSDQFRVGDGLKTIKSGEVDDIIIAGLGGHTIVDILNDDIVHTKSFKKLILQPRKHSGALRVWLYKNGFEIINEMLTSEGKFVCEIIVAKPNDGSNNNLPYPEDDIRWAYPELLKSCDPNLLLKRVNWKLESILEQISNMSNSNNNKDRINKLKIDYKYLKELINENEFRNNRNNR